MNAIAFGRRAQADRMTAHVRAMHRRVRGVLAEPAGPFAAGTPYRGDDPEHLLWILGALAESAMLVYSKYARTLSSEERDELWRDYRVVGRLFGLRERDMPADAAGFEAYMAERYASAGAASSRRRPASWRSTSFCARRCRCTCGRCSSWSTRSRSGCCRRACASSTASRWDPLRAAALHGGAEYVKRVVVPVLPERVRMLPLARAA